MRRFVQVATDGFSVKGLILVGEAAPFLMNALEELEW